jgi:hypothetical protein
MAGLAAAVCDRGALQGFQLIGGIAIPIPPMTNLRTNVWFAWCLPSRSHLCFVFNVN